MQNSTHVKAMLLAATALGFSAAAPALAQDSSDAAVGAATGGDIIVTARRSEERLQDVPISMTVLSQETMSKSNIVSTADLGAYVPSLSVNTQFGPEKASFVIRGFTQAYHTAPTVGVYFADVIAPRANGGTSSGNGAGVGSMFDLQNLQVLKGPQGTLFGRNTTGGAILLVPTKPTDRLEGYVEGSLGKYDLRRVEAVLNIPLSDTFRVRLGIDRNKRDGYLKNQTDIGPRRFRDTDYIAARLSVVADLTPDLENYTIFSYSRSNTNGEVPRITTCDMRDPATAVPGVSPLTFFACAQVARQEARGDSLWDVENNMEGNFQRIEQWQVINTTTWQASDNITIKNIMSYGEFRENFVQPLWGDNLIFPPGFPNAGAIVTKTIQFGLSPRGDNTQQSTFTEEFQIHGVSANGRLDWQTGAYMEISDPLGWNSALSAIFIDCTDITNLICTPSPGGAVQQASTKDKFRNYGLYAQADYKITDQLTVTGGFRYTMDRQKDVAESVNMAIIAPGTALLFCQNPVVFNGPGGVGDPLMVSHPSECRIPEKLKSSRPTWLIGLNFRPSDDVMLYAKYARGYRMGSITSQSVGFEVVGPEKVDTYEIGAKASFRGTVSGYFNIAGFYNDFQDQQLTVNPVVSEEFRGKISPPAPNVNAGKSRLWGIEADASLIPFRGLKIDAAYTYLNTKLQEFTPPPLPIYYSALFPTTDVGGPLPLAPKNKFTLTGTYTLPLDDSIGRISFGGTWSHTDAHPASSPGATPLYKLKKSDQINLNANWDSIMGSSFDLAFFMTNVTNEARIEFPAQSIYYTGADGGHVNQPRIWGVKLKYSFGE